MIWMSFNLINDPQFLPKLHKLKKFIHDFSNAQSVELKIDDLSQLVVLGKVQAVFTENIHGVIVFQSSGGLKDAELYRKGLVNTRWSFHVVNTVKEAMKILNAISN